MEDKAKRLIDALLSDAGRQYHATFSAEIESGLRAHKARAISNALRERRKIEFSRNQWFELPHFGSSARVASIFAAVLLVAIAVIFTDSRNSGNFDPEQRLALNDGASSSVVNGADLNDEITMVLAYADFREDWRGMDDFDAEVAAADSTVIESAEDEVLDTEISIALDEPLGPTENPILLNFSELETMENENDDYEAVDIG